MNTVASRPLWRGRSLALLGIVFVAANLRNAVAALSPIVNQINVDIPLNAVSLGVLGMLPPVCFAVFGIFTPMITRRRGLELPLVVALLAIMAGHVTRGLSDSLASLIIGSVIAFAGLGIGNVLLPPMVKKYFPDRVGLMTSLYVTVVSLSTLVPPLVAVPVADAAGWRISLGMWMLLALLALVPWITMLLRARTVQTPSPVVEEADSGILGLLWKSPIAWAITAVFAVSAINAYAMFAWLPQLLVESAGVTPAQAGTLLALYASMGIPCALIIPILAARLANIRPVVYFGVLAFLVGDAGLLFAPDTFTWLWVCLAGLGPLFFPLGLVLINLRTRTHAGAVALSSFVQSIGYTLGATGPLLFGLFHELSGGWTGPLIFLMTTVVAVIVAGAVIGRPHMLEDNLVRSR